MEKGQFVPSQEQIEKELIDIKDGEDRSSKRQFVALQEQVAKELCGVYHSNHINKEKHKSKEWNFRELILNGIRDICLPTSISREFGK